MGPVYDSFTHTKTIPASRDAEESPTEVRDDFSILAPEILVEAEVEEQEEQQILDSENLGGLFGRDIPPEVIEELENRPKIRYLTKEEAEIAVRKDKINKMTGLEKDVEGRFGMI